MARQANRNSRPAHACLQHLAVENDELVFAGRPLSELTGIAGQTPYYAYDLASIAERAGSLRSTLPDFVHLHFAIKANPHAAVVAQMASLVDGLDVASARELEVALETGIAPESISFAGPGKQPWELRKAIDAGIVINAESELELDRIGQLGEELGVRPKVAIRVNPDFELKSSGMKMGGGPKQFGIDAEQVPAILRSFTERSLDFFGFHIFSGSQNLRSDAICEAQSKSVELAIRLSEHAPSPVKMLNIGGGFGIPYFPGEDYLDLAPVADNLDRLRSPIRKQFPDAEIVVELGRYFVGEAGIYVCRIIDRKVSRGEVFLVTDGGLHHHLSASGNFGQVIRKNYPVIIGNRIAGIPGQNASVVGPLCTPLDLLADKMELGHGDVGDLVVVLQSGAYGYSASPHLFLSHPGPVEIAL